MNIHKDVDCVIANENELKNIVNGLAGKLNARYSYVDGKNSRLLVIGILKGAFVFLSDLTRKLRIPIQIDFMQTSSYGQSSVSGGDVKLKLDLGSGYDYAKTDILVVEDIIDTGRTFKNLTMNLQNRGAKSVEACALLDKPSRRVTEYTPEYTGKIIPDVFVVGYGLDFNERYRELPYVGALKSSIYTSK